MERDAVGNNETKEKLDAVVERAERDEEFRKRLETDPAGTLKGMELTEEDLRSVAGGAADVFLKLDPKVESYRSILSNFSKISPADFNFTTKSDKASPR
jgi:hypothetical protein